jgi:hypothetical protein
MLRRARWFADIGSPRDGVDMAVSASSCIPKTSGASPHWLVIPLCLAAPKEEEEAKTKLRKFRLALAL